MAIHGLRGRPSNLQFSPTTQRSAVAIPKPPEWADFGPAFAAAQSAKLNGARSMSGGRGDRGSAYW